MDTLTYIIELVHKITWIVLSGLGAYYVYKHRNDEVPFVERFMRRNGDDVRFWFYILCLFAVVVYGPGLMEMTFSTRELVHIVAVVLFCTACTYILRFGGWFIHDRRDNDGVPELHATYGVPMLHELPVTLLQYTVVSIFAVYIADGDVTLIYIMGLMVVLIALLQMAHSYWLQNTQAGVRYSAWTKKRPALRGILETAAIPLSAFVLIVAFENSLLLFVLLCFVGAVFVVCYAWSGAVQAFAKERRTSKVLGTASQILEYLVDQYDVDLEMESLDHDTGSLHLLFTVREPFDYSRLGSWVREDLHERFSFEHVEWGRVEDDGTHAEAGAVRFRMRAW